MSRLLIVGFPTPHSPLVDQAIPGDTHGFEIQKASSTEDALEMLASDPTIRLVVCCLDSHDLRALADVQHMRNLHPDVLVLAFFDIGADASTAIQTTRHLIATLGRHSGPEETPEDVPHPETADAAYADATQITDVACDDASIPLTPRQLDVLRALTEGKSNKEIARRLDLCEGTVKVHCMAIFRELGVTNRTQAAIVASKILQPGSRPAAMGLAQSYAK